jgi:hypothetical protein
VYLPRYSITCKGPAKEKVWHILLEKPGALTPFPYTNLALNNAGLMGSILVDFPKT